jgi:hypothetical protein
MKLSGNAVGALPLGEEAVLPLSRKLDGPQGWSAHFEEQSSVNYASCPGHRFFCVLAVLGWLLELKEPFLLSPFSVHVGADSDCFLTFLVFSCDMYSRSLKGLSSHFLSILAVKRAFSFPTVPVGPNWAPSVLLP